MTEPRTSKDSKIGTTQAITKHRIDYVGYEVCKMQIKHSENNHW